MTQTPASSRSTDRLALILQQVDTLPTLPSVAMELLRLTSDEQTHANQVVELIRDDPALTGKVLALCRGASLGVRASTMTIDRAVTLLGFEAIRNAVLSIKVAEAFADDPPRDPDAAGYDRAALWRHCLGVAIAAELIAEAHEQKLRVEPAEAFVCGLLHDVGKLALDHVLPKAYQRVVELTDQSQACIAAVERKVIGLDHHAAGRRLALRWGLSQAITDCIWLHGQPPEALPSLPHRKLIALVSLADLYVRQLHIGYSGNHRITEDPADRLAALDLDPRRTQQAVGRVHDELERRAAALGLAKAAPDRKLFLESIMQANQMLGRLNQRLREHQRRTGDQGRTLDAVAAFGRQLQQCQEIGGTLAAVAASAAGVFEADRVVLVHQPRDEGDWKISQFDGRGRLLRGGLAEPTRTLAGVAPSGSSARLVDRSVLRAIKQATGDGRAAANLQATALPASQATVVLAWHPAELDPAGTTGDRPADGPAPAPVAPEQIAALSGMWGAAIAAADRHEAAAWMSEQLAQAHADRAEAQQRMLATQALARVGQMAAGAAHEMNNPLAVISGRAQLLSVKLEAGSREQADAALICEHAQKLSDLITALHVFAQPPEPHFKQVAIDDVMTRASRLVHAQMPDAKWVQLSPSASMPPLRTDPDHLARALAELLLNAHQARPKSAVQVKVRHDPLEHRLLIQVIDNGVGMDPQTLAHATDPFFSSRPAGRGTGLGLSRASRLVEGLDGRIVLASEPTQGTTATINLPLQNADNKPGASESPQPAQADQVQPARTEPADTPQL